MLGSIAIKNLRHRPARTLLTMGGVSIGIAAVIATLSVARGFEKGWERVYTARGTDLIVTRVTSDNPLPELFGEEVRANLQALPGVEKACGILIDVTGIEDVPMVFLFGWESGCFLWDHVRLQRGRWIADGTENTVLLGSIAADLMKKNVGDSVFVETGEFKVCGIFESQALIENSSVVMSLARMQTLLGQPGKVRHVNLKLAASATPEALARLREQIRVQNPGFKAYTAGEIARDNSALRIIQAMSWAASIIALVVGVFGVMNTMAMSVFERTREIGVLLAVGWRRNRVVKLILLESFFLSLAGWVFGVLLGIGIVQVVERLPMVRGKLEGELTPALILAAAAVAIGVGLLGGLQPALRGSRLPPCEALRHE